MTSSNQYTRAGEVDIPRVSTLLALAFGGEDQDCGIWLRASGLDNLRLWRDSHGSVNGTVLRIEMAQYFGGTSVPMVGIAGVSVAPETRGEGVATEMMKACVRELHAEGWPISALYPSTQPLYRKVGYEQVSHRFMISVPIGRLSTNISHVKGWTVRPLDERDFVLVQKIYGQFASAWPGMLDRSEYCWTRLRKWRGVEYRGFGAYSPSGELCGYLYMSQTRKPESGRFDVSVSDIGWMEPDAARRLLMFIADFTTMGDDCVLQGGASHPLCNYIHHNIYQMRLRDPWMLRITDVKKAIEARGYSRAVNVSTSINVVDDVVPPNSGTWEIHIGAGKGRAAHSTQNTAVSEIDICTLAQIWSGYLSVEQAIAMKFVSGDPANLLQLAPAFAGPTPWMTDFF